MTLTDSTAPRRTPFHWLAVTFCALGILLAAFFNLGAASADHVDDMSEIFLLPTFAES